jgi:type I restriction enzyme S subunit
MKPSDLPWLCDIPAHWRAVRVKEIADRSVPYPIGDGDHGQIGPNLYTQDGVPYIRVQNLGRGFDVAYGGLTYISPLVHDENPKSHLHPGDILLAKTGATAGKTALVPPSMPQANTTSSVAKLTVDKRAANNRFILYALASPVVQHQVWAIATQKSAQPGFNIDDFKVFWLPLPPLLEQSAIVTFLDYAGAGINRAIEAKRKTIGLLNEQKQAIIHQVVTRGLDPTARLKPSGSSWIGEMPERWARLAIKRRCQIFAGATPSRAVPAYWDGGTIPWLSSSQVNDRAITSAKQMITEAGMRASSTKWIEPGSLVVALAGQGRTKGMVATVEFKSTCNQSLAVISPRGTSWNYKYLAYFLEASYKDIRALVGDGLRDGLNLQHIGGILAPMPPRDEQHTIVAFLEAEGGRIDAGISRLESEIGLLTEYHTRLTSDVVTGKLDVREAAKSLPALDEGPSDRVEAPAVGVEDDLEFVETP